MKHLTVRDLSLELQPREKLLAKGPGELSTIELVAILLRTGTKKENCLQVAQRLLSLFSPKELLGLTPKQLVRIHGIGSVKACILLAALELGKRACVAQENRVKVASMHDIGPKYMQMLGTEPIECFYGIYLDARQKIIREERLTVGITNASLIHPREFFRPAIQCGAFAAIAVHNHPSGDPTPSKEDYDVTRSLEEAGNVVGIPLLDHVVVSAHGYDSAQHRE